MNISRRVFLKFASAAGVLAATGANIPVSAARNSGGNLPTSTAFSPGDALGNLTSDDFKRHLGAEFLVETERGMASAILSDLTQTSKPVQTARNSTRNASRKIPAETFSLSFRLSDTNLTQKTYRLWQADIGEFDLFLVPHMKSNETLLIAVINRI